MPDTFGLLEYFVTDIFTEVVGTNVRIVCGARHGNEVQWLYSVIMPAERLLICSRVCGDAATEAFNVSQMEEGAIKRH